MRSSNDSIQVSNGALTRASTVGTTSTIFQGLDAQCASVAFSISAENLSHTCDYDDALILTYLSDESTTSETVMIRLCALGLLLTSLTLPANCIEYTIRDTYVGEGFLSGFTHQAISDPTHGRVQYVSALYILNPIRTSTLI